MRSQDYLEFKSGYRTALLDGTMVQNSPKHMATEKLYHALQGSRLQLCMDGYEYAVAVFDLQREGQCNYSYAYYGDESWTTYTRNLTPQSYQTEDFIFEKECFFRVCMRRLDENDLEVQDIEQANQLMLCIHKDFFYVEKEYYRTEMMKMLRELRKNRKVKIWAHRGASGHAPENTLPAFKMAYELGADGIELDVQLTKDGIPVVIHDETVDRVSNGIGWVKDYTLWELKQLNAGKKFPAYGNVSVPTLEEVYDFVKNTDMIVNLELKNSVCCYEHLEEKVLQLAEEKGISDRVIYSSFNHYSMRRIKELKPNAKVAFLYADGILDIAEYGEKYGVYAVHPSMRNLQYPDVVAQCHAKDIKVHVWTVNEVSDIKKMQELGVDAVITNYAERG